MKITIVPETKEEKEFIGSVHVLNVNADSIYAETAYFSGKGLDFDIDFRIDKIGATDK